MWQMICTFGTFNINVTNKIIIKNSINILKIPDQQYEICPHQSHWIGLNTKTPT